MTRVPPLSNGKNAASCSEEELQFIERPVKSAMRRRWHSWSTCSSWRWCYSISLFTGTLNLLNAPNVHGGQIVHWVFCLIATATAICHLTSCSIRLFNTAVCRRTVPLWRFPFIIRFRVFEEIGCSLDVRYFTEKVSFWWFVLCLCLTGERNTATICWLCHFFALFWRSTDNGLAVFFLCCGHNQTLVDCGGML